MVGLGGARGSIPGKAFRPVINRDWHDRQKVTRGDWQVELVSHGAKDPNSCRVWEGDDCAGTLWGVIRNEDDLDVHLDDLPRRIIADPHSNLPLLEGSFVMVALSDEEVIVATDRLGTRPVFYLPDGPPMFSTNVSSLMQSVSNPTVNLPALANLIMYSSVQGQDTLVKEVKAVPAGSYVRFETDQVEVRRYNWLDFSYQTHDYVASVLHTYRSAVERSVDTISKDAQAGAWLSGGLDSRLFVGIASDMMEQLHTITYDANPGDGSNVAAATAVANTIGVSNELAEFRPDEFADELVKGVQLVDGRFSLHDMHNLPYILRQLENQIDVLFEVSGQGELFGESVTVETLRRAEEEDPITLYQSSFSPPGRASAARDVFTRDIDVTKSLRETAESIPHKRSTHVFIELINQSFYPNGHYRPKTALYSNQVSYRAPLSDSRILAISANLPSNFRRRNSSPFTLGFSKDPVSKLKLALIREFDRGLQCVPYERTGLPPAYPLALHTYNLVLGELRSLCNDFIQSLTGSKRTRLNPLYARWYRENDNVREVLDGYYEDAMGRRYYDEDELERLRTAHLAGRENAMRVIAAITTGEIWIQNNLE